MEPESCAASPRRSRRAWILRAPALAALLVLATAAAAATAPVPDPDRAPPLAPGQCVVLLHGLGRSHLSMARIDAVLRGAGYATANIDYPSQSQPIEALATAAVPQGLADCRRQGASTIHFVTHSMGGLLVRYYLEHQAVPELGRVVMLGPPNQGSEVADALVGTALYDRVNGPAGAQLVTGPAGIAARLGPVRFPLGVIAGNVRTAIDGVLAAHIPGENDGKVAVERARVEGMSDFLVLPVNHTFMVFNDAVIGQVLQFLREGHFLHEDLAHAPALPGAAAPAPPALEKKTPPRGGVPVHGRSGRISRAG